MKFKSDIEVQAGLKDSSGSAGSSGQILTSTGTQTFWATTPITPGTGGSSQVFYFNGSIASSVAGYKQMSPTAYIGAGTDFSISANGYIASFLTDVNSPNQLNIPAGNWNFEIYMNSSSSGNTPSFYVELYKYASGVFTLIASSSAAPEYITNGTIIDLYMTALAVPATVLTVTDRLAVRVYVLNSGKTITMHTEDSHLCEVITTFSTGISALNGLTPSVQYFATNGSGTDFNIVSSGSTHTFNLPTASATNRGALSSANWTTFNNKADDANVVHKTGNETITGTKTFNKTGTDTSIKAFNTTGGYSVYLQNDSPVGNSLFANNLSAGTGISVGNSSTGIGISSVNSLSGIGIFSDNYDTGEGIRSNNNAFGTGFYSSNQSAGIGIYSNNTSTGTGISSSNISAGTGISSNNTSIGIGIYSSNASTGGGIYSVNSSTGKGIDSSNTGIGIGIYSTNNSTGAGIKSYNSSTGDGLALENGSSGNSVKSNNTSTGTAFYLHNESSGKNLVLNNAAASTGMPFTIKKNGNDVFTVNDAGTITSSGGAALALLGGAGVGIGTATATEKLEVNGNIKATGAISATNLSGANTGDQTLEQVLDKGNVSSINKGIYVYVNYPDEGALNGVNSALDGVGVFGYSNSPSAGIGGLFQSDDGIGLMTFGGSGTGKGIVAYSNGETGVEVNLGNSSKGLVINSGASSTGNFIELDKNGVDKLIVTQNGAATFASTVTAPTFIGTLSGNSSTVTTNANLTGVVTSLGNATSIANGVITNAMLSNGAVANLSGINTNDETTATIKSKLGITTLSGSNTGDQDLSGFQLTSAKDAINGYAGLDASGKLNPLQLPALAITDTFVVATQAAMLALTAEVGDVAVRTDLNKSFILRISGSSTLANWQELLSPTDSVSSVFGRSGAVSSQSGDYTADQITQTATRVFTTPAEKTAITHTNRASLDLVSGTNTGDQDLSGKANLASPTFTGNVGFGTSNPTEIVHLRSSQPVIRFEKAGVLNWRAGVISGNTFTINVDSGVADPFNITTGGYVGFGTPTPAARLETISLSSSLPATSGTISTAGLRVASGTTTTGTCIDFGSFNSTGAGWLQSTDRNDLSQKFPLLLNPNGGNVGIATSTPAARLHVVGGSITTSISNISTTLNSRFDLANPAISLGIGYLSSDQPFLQAFNNTSSIATTLNFNPFGGTAVFGGAATFAPSVSAKNIQVAGASGGYTTGDNPMIGFGNAPATNSFGTIEHPFGDKMIFNDYHGYNFKVANGGSTPVEAFRIDTNRAATFASSVTAQNASGNFFSAKNTVGGVINLGINSNASSTAYISYTNSLAFTGGAATFDSTVTATAYIQSSDLTLKDVISQDGDVIHFKWKDGRDNLVHIGYSAQEKQIEYKDQIHEDDKGLLSVNYIEILVQKIKDLENRVLQLEKK